MRRLAAAVFVGWMVLAPVAFAYAQPPLPASTADAKKATAKSDDDDKQTEADTSEKGSKKKSRGDILSDTPDTDTQLEQLQHALARLPIAAGLASILALRPRRRGTPKRQASVIQTQIILAIVGALVMLVVGTSLARAFGIVGAAGLVRYRSKIEDPKDAGVMLSTLAIGLASGVGLWMMALFATGFVLAFLWAIESFEPKVHAVFTLTVKASDPDEVKPGLESVLRRHQVKYELRSSTPEQICYEVRLPLDQKTDPLSGQLRNVDHERITAVVWEEKKEKKL